MRAILITLILVGCGKEADPSCITDTEQFENGISAVLQERCITCHVAGGLAGDTRNVLLPSSEAGYLAANLDSLRPLALETEQGTSLLLLKIQGELNHGGGPVVLPNTDEYQQFEAFVARSAAPGGCDDPGSIETCPAGLVAPGPTPLRRLTSTQYTNTVRDLLGVQVAKDLFPPTSQSEIYSTWTEANLVSSAGIEGVMLAAESAAKLATVDTQALTGCEPLSSTCARDWAHDFAYRAFRRPLTTEETALVDTLWSLGVDEADGASLVVEFVLQSPQFLYLDADSTPSETANVDALTPHAVAARLSYFLLNTTPSSSLMAQASDGQLDTREQVLAVAREMVADPRAVPVVAQFHQDWLHTYQLATIAKDATVYPEFGPALVDQMLTEIDLFTTEVVWQGDPTFDALLYSSASWTSPALDEIYGTSAQRQGEGWERRTLDESRPGVLTRSGFLTAHAYSATSAPVRRGVFVIEQMLCNDLSPPPGISLELDEATESNTIRERLANHASDPVCAGCHKQIDPLGFSFENYGALGEWRDNWSNGIAIDASGTLEDPAGSFVGTPQMLGLVDSNSRVRDCYAQQWFEYGLGRGVNITDQCQLDRLAKRFAFTGGDLHDLVVQVAASEALRYRQTPVLENP